MANYTCAIRTNYFRVKDPEAFRAFMQHVYGAESPVELWEETDKDGNLVFGFGAFGAITGLNTAADDPSGDADTDGDSYESFLDGLQTHVADDDAIIILEAGREKLNYIVGTALIITSKEYAYLDATNLAIDHAAKLLDNPTWSTKCDY